MQTRKNINFLGMNFIKLGKRGSAYTKGITEKPRFLALKTGVGLYTELAYTPRFTVLRLSNLQRALNWDNIF